MGILIPYFQKCYRIQVLYRGPQRIVVSSLCSYTDKKKFVAILIIDLIISKDQRKKPNKII
jgi:hypothetical protein